MNYGPPIEDFDGDIPPPPSFLSVQIEGNVELDGTPPVGVSYSLPDADLTARIAGEVEALPDEVRLQVSLDVEGRNQICQVDSAQLAQIGLDSLGGELYRAVQETPGLGHLLPALASEFTKDPQVRLKMLRAEHYNCERAALRFAHFLNLLQEVFGPTMLRPIYLSDLTEEDRQFQRRGTHQLFRFRDHSGRRIAGCFDVEPPGTASPASQVGDEQSPYIVLSRPGDEQVPRLPHYSIFLSLAFHFSAAPRPPVSDARRLQRRRDTEAGSGLHLHAAQGGGGRGGGR
jgi:hypothetical protein